MDNSNLERRFSLNATHITNPIAESTCLNINGTSASTHFPWGGTPISPKTRSNSSSCLSSSNGNTQNNTNISGQSTNQDRIKTSRIDPRVYTDVQSYGLASRIVKYHEKGARLNRSHSLSNLYNKPGQFPVVHLKKIELPYRATKPNPSMTRIAPPEKSIFYGNTLSSILRSNSVVGLHKSDEELFRENRPILHPPPTENELAPTRSVLEVLKEISRKRINSDDLDSNETMKKYCNRDMNDPTSVASNINQLQTNKRQREHLNHQQQFNNPQQQYTNYLTNQHSPEQISKKRLCSYNNDITSSLSSSQIQVNKRKFLDKKNSNESLLSLSSAETDYENGTTKKMQRQQPELRFKKLSNSLHCHVPITAIPPTPLNQTVCEDNRAQRYTPLGVAPQRTVSEPVYQSTRLIVDVPCVAPNKQKITLFNKNYNEEKESFDADKISLVNETTDDDKFADIPFVKPKKNISSTGAKNPIIERTQKSKLALMLSGLRGELYSQDENEVDLPLQGKVQNKEPEAIYKITTAQRSATDNINITTKTKSNSFGVNITESPLTTVPVTFASSPATNISATNTIVSSADASSLDSLKSIGQTTANSVEDPPLTTSRFKEATKTSSSLVGIKLKPQAINSSGAFPTAEPIKSVQGFTSSTTSIGTIPTSTVNTALPVMGGFSFDKSPTKQTNSLFTATRPTASIGGFAFSAAENLTTTAVSQSALVFPGSKTSFSSNSPASTLPSFTMVGGSKATTTNFGVPPESIATAVASSFGNSTSAKTTTTEAASLFSVSSPTTKNEMFKTSGSSNVLATAHPTAATSAAGTASPFGFVNSSASTVTSSGFSFGLPSGPGKPSAVATPFLIDSTEMTPNKSPAIMASTNNNFNFGGTAVSSSSPVTIHSTSTSNKFTFESNASAASSASNAFNFGVTKSTSNPPNAFSSNLLSSQSQTSAFVSPTMSAENISPFTFGGNLNAAASVDKPSSFSFNSVSLPSSSTTPSANIFGSTAIINAVDASVVKSSFNFSSPNTASANVTANKTFAFGSTNNATISQGVPANLYSPVMESKKPGVSGGFSFNSINKPTTPAFAFGNTVGNGAAATATSTTNTQTPFAFGNSSSASTNNATAVNKNFAFGSNVIPNSSTNLFDQPSAPNVAAAPFTFISATSSTASAATPSNGNIFAAVPQNTLSGFGDRRIRRATRRLQKS